MCKRNQSYIVQQQAALAGAQFGYIFDVPGLALTLNLTPSLEEDFSLRKLLELGSSKESYSGFMHRLPKPKYDI